MSPKEGVPHRLVNAVVPLVVLVGGTLGFLFVTGEGSTLREIVGSADSYASLVYGSIVAIVVAGVMTIAQRVLSLSETVQAWFAGVKSVLYVLIVLVLAWALSAVTGELGTAEYLADLLGSGLPMWILPALLFVTASATSFATGTSWGTMGILMPLAVPLTWAVAQNEALANDAALSALYVSISTILAGAVFGDHCSPISDTTVLSSLASGCEPIDHVRTQLPYALLAGGAAVVALILIGVGLPWWIIWPVAVVGVLGYLRWFGRVVAEELVEAETDRSPGES
jgi:Na+/H+ antiporter NhaC